MIYRSLVILGVSVGLSGCLSLLPSPKLAPSVYRLSTNVDPVKASANAEIIRVSRPSSTRIFNTSDIVVTMDGQKMSAVANASWSEATPVMIQGAIIDALSGSAQFIGLAPSSGAKSETRVHLTIKNFEANFDNGSGSAPLAVVQYSVTYASSDDRKLLGTHIVRETRRADSIKVSSIINAMETANQAAMVDIVNWLETERGRTGS